MDGPIQRQQRYIFELNDDEAYAGTYADVWHAIQAFNNCEVISLNQLTPGERECLICELPFDDPEDGEEVLHVPVRLPCWHVLGKECLAKRITPFGAWQENWNSEWEERNGWFKLQMVRFSGSADCPVCRQALFPPPLDAESALGLEARLILWDRSYARVGCLRSDQEEQSRADLIRYVEFNRLANGDFVENQQIDVDQRWDELQRFHSAALRRLLTFVIRRRTEGVLAPNPARIRRNLQQISLEGIDTVLDDTFRGYGLRLENVREGSSTKSNDINMEDNDHDMGERNMEDHESDMEDVGDDEGSSIKSDDTQVQDDESEETNRESDHTHVENDDGDTQDDGDDDTDHADEGEAQVQVTRSFSSRMAIILRELERVGK